MSDYEAYEKECDKIREANNEYLDLFEANLQSNDLSAKTIRKHISNVYFYINEYILREEPRPMEDGTGMIDMFLGYFFIRKCMWSTPGTIKSTASSIKKFYKCMLDHNKIDKSNYDYLCSEIKENMEQWQADCAMYNDADAPNPFWF